MSALSGEPGARFQRGFSLVEFMTSAALTLLLLGGVFAIFSGSRASFSKGQQIGDIQESGRYAMERIVHDVRMAGFPGCASAVSIEGSTWYQPELMWNFMDDAIRGFESDVQASWPPSLRASVATSTALQSDVLVVQVPVGLPVRLREPMSRDSEPLVVSENDSSRLNLGDVMLASDCRAKSYFAVTSIDKTTVSYEAASVGNPRELTHSLGYSFPADAELTTVETHVYFVRETTGGSPALWRRAGARPPEEIAQGVNDMQLQFGVDSDGDGAVDAYLSAEKVSLWKNVRTVLIDLSVQASASAVSDASRRDIRQQGIAERTRMAEVFTAAVTLRNAVMAQ